MTDVYADGLATCWRHVAGELGITYRQLDHWTMRGYLRPGQDTRSQGVPRRWPAAELEIARRMGRLTAAGLAAERAAVFARESWPRGEIAPGIWLDAGTTGAILREVTQ